MNSALNKHRGVHFELVGSFNEVVAARKERGLQVQDAPYIMERRQLLGKRFKDGQVLFINRFRFGSSLEADLLHIAYFYRPATDCKTTQK